MFREKLNKALPSTIVVLMAIVMVISGIIGAFFIIESRSVIDNTLENNNGNVSGDGGGNSNMAAPSVPEDAPFKVATAEEMLADGKVHSRYVSPTLGTPIANASSLMTWLVSSQDSDAYLTNDINDFDWANFGANGIYKPTAGASGNKAMILRGKTLDGAGFTIRMIGRDKLNSTGGNRAAAFAYKIEGNLINTTFDFSGYFHYEVGAQNTEHRYGLISEEITWTGVVRNCKINVNGDTRITAYEGGNGSWNAGVYGNFAGALGGKIYNSTVTINNYESEIWMDGNGADAASAYGGFAGLMNNDSLIKDCTFEYKKGRIISNSWGGGYGWANAVGGAVGINGIAMGGTGDGGTGTIDGFISKGYTSTPVRGGTGNNWGHLVGYSQGVASERYSRIYTQATDGTVGSVSRGDDLIPYYKSSAGATLSWNRTNGNIIINPVPSNDKILWQYAYVNNGDWVGGVDNSCMVYDYELKSAISIKSHNPVWNGKTGNELRILQGEVGVIAAIQSRSVNYNGLAHTITPTITSSAGTSWSNTNAYKVLYNNNATAPGVPSVAPYAIKIRNTTDIMNAKYAYFDSGARQFVRINDSFNSTLTINPSDITMTAKASISNSYIDYVDGVWTASAIDIRASMLALSNNGVAVANKIGITQDDGATWIDIFDWAPTGTLSVTKLTRPSRDGTKFRFALFRDDVRVSNLSAKGVFAQIDLTAPTISLHDKHVNAEPGSIGDLNAWKDNYNTIDDALSAAQVWINANAGPSGIQVYARATRNGELTRPDGSWGNLTAYHPTVDGIELTDVFKQTFYEGKYDRNNHNATIDNHRKYSGIYQVEFKAVNGVGIAAKGGENGIVKVNVKIDYSNYSIDLKEYWNGQITQTALTGATDYAGSAAAGKLYKRTEVVAFDINTTDNGSEGVDPTTGYAFVSLAGVDSGEAHNFKHNYKIAQSNDWNVAESGKHTRTIVVETYLKKAYFGKLLPINNYIYGDTIPNEFAHSLGDADGRTFNVVFNTIAVTGSRVGIYDVLATAAFDEAALNEQYVGFIKSTMLEITPMPIKLQYDKLTAALRNYTDQWIITTIITTLYGEDVVNRLRVVATSGEDITTTGSYEVIAIIDNSNYMVENVAQLVVVPFMIDESGNSLIETKEDFAAVIEKEEYRDLNYKLINDIDYENKAFSGNKGTFRGTIDGAGFKLSNILLTKTSEENDYALFETLTGTIKNLTITNLSVLGISDVGALKIGGITANLQGGTISNVFVQLTVTGRGQNDITIGGLAAKSTDNASITNSMVIIDADISTRGVARFGGVVGDSSATEISGNKVFAQAVVKGAATSGAHEIAVVREQTTIRTNEYLTSGININGVTVKNTITGNTAGGYSSFYTSGKFGNVSNVGGTLFRDVIKKVMPAHMFRGGADGTKANPVIVATFSDMLLMLKFRFANYKITANIICFNGYTYAPYDSFSGEINHNGFKIMTSAGVEIKL